MLDLLLNLQIIKKIELIYTQFCPFFRSQKNRYISMYQFMITCSYFFLMKIIVKICIGINGIKA